jgi:hypothetical protein
MRELGGIGDYLVVCCVAGRQSPAIIDVDILIPCSFKTKRYELVCGGKDLRLVYIASISVPRIPA